MEPRVSYLVESEIVNDGQKVLIVIKMIVERISYSLEHVYNEKIVPTLNYETVWLGNKTLPVNNKNDISEMHAKTT